MNYTLLCLLFFVNMWKSWETFRCWQQNRVHKCCYVGHSKDERKRRQQTKKRSKTNIYDHYSKHAVSPGKWKMIVFLLKTNKIQWCSNFVCVSECFFVCCCCCIFFAAYSLYKFNCNRWKNMSKKKVVAYGWHYHDAA